MTQPIDVVGQKFGRYTVIAKSDKRSKAMKQMVLCKCDCGIEKEVIVSNLKSGISKSCGCLKAELVSKRRKKHGFSKTTMYYRYKHMIQRCYFPDNPEYHNYGGRGIKVCDSWLESVENYINDMGFPPFKTAQIDRINNDLGYFKDNCRWATPQENSLNKRRKVL